jgi:16S rRNA (guanine527-N7)-methyltransferase
VSDLLLELLDIARARGFLGPGDVVFHVEHARRFEPLVPPTARVLDLGSGGGVPGLVLINDRPDLSVTLLDANERRTSFLEEALERGAWLDRADVVRARAEQAGRDEVHRGRYDVVVSRSFGPPAVVAECAAPLLTVGGSLIVSEPPEEIGVTTGSRWDSASLAMIGLEPTDRHRSEQATLQVLTQKSACPERYPRRVGVPAKRPLF